MRTIILDDLEDILKIQDSNEDTAVIIEKIQSDEVLLTTYLTLHYGLRLAKFGRSIYDIA